MLPVTQGLCSSASGSGQLRMRHAIYVCCEQPTPQSSTLHYVIALLQRYSSFSDSYAKQTQSQKLVEQTHAQFQHSHNSGLSRPTPGC